MTFKFLHFSKTLQYRQLEHFFAGNKALFFRSLSFCWAKNERSRSHGSMSDTDSSLYNILISCTKFVRSALKQWSCLWGRWASLVLLPALGSSHRLGRTACHLWINSIFPPGVSPQNLPVCCWTEHPVRFSHTSNCCTCLKWSSVTTLRRRNTRWAGKHSRYITIITQSDFSLLIFMCSVHLQVISGAASAQSLDVCSLLSSLCVNKNYKNLIVVGLQQRLSGCTNVKLMSSSCWLCLSSLECWRWK